jgi:uncharacterized protein (TIGR03437 family)
MRHALGAIPFLLAAGAFPALTDTLPAHCGGVGAKSYTPPPYTVPAVVLNRGAVITVTNATVAINGDTSSVAALLANPGADGISIEEAINATNNDPGTWNIQFVPALKGSTIVVDSAPGGTLSGLSGGNVTINGDINGDGQPDITLTSMSGMGPGFVVASGGNTLYALALQNFRWGVWVSPPGPEANGMTFSNITISNLVITNTQIAGIYLFPADASDTWDHLQITGNTITGNVSGPIDAIDLELGSTGGDTLQHTTIANNNIVLPMPGAGGIAMNFGAGLGATNNQALDTLIANNVISASLPQFGIRIATGVGSASGNLIDGMQVIGNQIDVTGPVPVGGSGQPSGIIVASGDAASDDFHPPLFPIQYSENNILRNLSILSNTIAGNGGFGINLEVACCGNRNNTIDSLSILGNTIGVTQNGVLLMTGSSGGYYSRTTTANVLSNVLVESNTIQMTPTICNCYPLGLTFGGINVIAGWEEPGNSVNGILIANNEVDTPLVGISIIGGVGGSGAPSAPVSPADNNVVSGAQISCNQVDQAPTLGLQFPGIQGIDVTAGMLNASGNQIQQPAVVNNLVAGALGGTSFFSYLGLGAPGNSISISGSSGPINGPQASAPVNSATFQPTALAAGSLVSMFGLNLNGATVQFNNLSAPVIYTSASQLNVQVPWELQGSPYTWVTVTANSITSTLVSVQVGPADPGIFSLGAPQGGQGAIVNLAGMVVDASSPAHAGDYLQIYGTGLGAVSNTPQTGAAAVATPLSQLIGNATATIGGVSTPVSFAGLAPGFVGLYQVNVQVPPGVAPGDAVPVILSAGGLTSNSVTISVR